MTALSAQELLHTVRNITDLDACSTDHPVGRPTSLTPQGLGRFVRRECFHHGLLATLGERERGTERLEQAVTAFTEALKERTRARVPLDRAATQNKLGHAIQILRERGRAF